MLAAAFYFERATNRTPGHDCFLFTVSIPLFCLLFSLHNTILLNYRRRRNVAATSFHCCLRDWSYAWLLTRTVDRALATLAAAFFWTDGYLNFIINVSGIFVVRFIKLCSRVLACFDHSLYYYTSNQSILFSQSSSLSLRITVSSLLLLSLRSFLLNVPLSFSFLFLLFSTFFTAFLYFWPLFIIIDTITIIKLILN